MDRKFKPKTMTNDTTNKDALAKKQNLYLVLPYFNNKLEDFSSKMNKLVNEFYSDIQLKIMFTCPTTIGNIFKFKDKTPDHLKSLVVYRIKCKDCGDFWKNIPVYLSTSV